MNPIIKYFLDKLALQIVGKLATWLGKYLPYTLEEWKRKKEREIAQKEAKEKHEEVLANPEATREELAKALEDRLNAGKKQ